MSNLSSEEVQGRKSGVLTTIQLNSNNGIQVTSAFDNYGALTTMKGGVATATTSSVALSTGSNIRILTGFANITGTSTKPYAITVTGASLGGVSSITPPVGTYLNGVSIIPYIENPLSPTNTIQTTQMGYYFDVSHLNIRLSSTQRIVVICTTGAGVSTTAGFTWIDV